MKEYPKAPKNDRMWWIITILLFCTGAFWWAGLAVLFLNMSGKLPTVQSLVQAIKDRLHGTRTLPEQTAVPRQETRVQRRQTRRAEKSGRGIWKTILGAVLLLLGASIGMEILENMLGRMSFASWMLAGGLVTFLLVAGLLLIVSGLQTRRQKRRTAALRAMLGRMPGADIPISELARALGRSERSVIRDLTALIEEGALEGAWIDRGAGVLRTSPLGQEAAADSAADDETEAILRKIRADNDLIGDPEISRKIDRIEALTRALLDFQQTHPERKNELHTFTSYYLPQTFKLLEAYARLEAQNIRTENAENIKARISKMLDQLITGYERLLSRLQEADAVDITAEMQVMEQMLQRDGLGEDDFAL